MALKPVLSGNLLLAFLVLTALPAFSDEVIPYQNPARQSDSIRQGLLSSTHSLAVPNTRVIIPLNEQPDLTFAVSTMVGNKVLSSFKVDHKARYSVAGARLVQKLGIQVDRNTPRVEVETATGMEKLPLVTVKNVSLGQITVPEVQMIVMPDSETDTVGGTLGLNCFAGMNATIKRGKLILDVPATMSAYIN